MGALLCLSVSIASGVTHPGAAVPLILAQATSNSSGLNCQTERQQTEEAVLNAIFGQAEQAIATLNGIHTRRRSFLSQMIRWQPGDAIEEPQGVYRLPDGQLVMSRECSLDER